MGLPRSGTNAMNLIMNLNFDHYVCDMNYHWVDWLGWKHAKAPELNALNLIEKRTGNDVCFIFMFRDFDEWEYAVVNRYSGQASGEFTSYSFGHDGFIFNTPMGGEYYDNLYEFYQDRVNSYETFVEKNPQKSIILNFSDLKNQPELLEQIKKHFGLLKSNQEYVVVNKKVTFNNTLTNNKVEG